MKEADIGQATRPNQITDLHLPHPNAFIPQDLTVEKREVSQVRALSPPYSLPHEPSYSPQGAPFSSAKRPHPPYGTKRMISSGCQKAILAYSFERESCFTVVELFLTLLSPVAVSSAKNTILTRSSHP